MAFQSSAIPLFLLLNILLAMAGHVLAGRAGPTKQNEDDKKQPEWFIEPDGSVLIPGIGRILVPMPGHGKLYHHKSYPIPNYGGTGGSSSPDPNYGRNGGSSSPIPNYGGTGGSSSPDPNYSGNGGSSSPIPNYGGTGGSGGNSGSTHIPGGDDTFVPNPGFEVPVPSAP